MPETPLQNMNPWTLKTKNDLKQGKGRSDTQKHGISSGFNKHLVLLQSVHVRLVLGLPRQEVDAWPPVWDTLGAQVMEQCAMCSPGCAINA